MCMYSPVPVRRAGDFSSTYGIGYDHERQEALVLLASRHSTYRHIRHAFTRSGQRGALNLDGTSHTHRPTTGSRSPPSVILHPHLPSVGDFSSRPGTGLSSGAPKPEVLQSSSTYWRKPTIGRENRNLSSNMLSSTTQRHN